jgi:hydrophobic/amphiphilic exporter-1 (mainly G- bacteria), HAE1 family
MNIASPFIRRPVMTSLVTVAILVFGVMAFRRLPVSDLPNVDYPTIQVQASLRGATAETMASSVATPLERQFSTIAGLELMNSSSSQGNTQINLQFELSRDIDDCGLDVQAAISRAMRYLPQDMTTPPSFQKGSPADQPILLVALTSPTLPLYELNEYAETIIAQRVSTVSGVAQVQVYGSQKYAVRIQLDPHELAVRSIGLDEVADAVQRANVNLPTGVLWGPQRAYAVEASGQLMRAEAYRSLIVAYRNGAPVRLEEVGRVSDSVENDKVAAWYYTPDAVQRSIVLAIQRQPGRNTVEVAGNVRKLLSQIGATLPSAVSMRVLFDNSGPIEESYHDVTTTLWLTIGLVVVTLFVFLRNASATLIPSMALPMSLVGTFVAMYLFGYSLDNLSLMALTLAMGFVVDDAIVVLENIVRHREMGKSMLDAALDGSREIGFTIVSMTLSLAAVFIPVLLMGGLVGRVFREFSVTIIASVLVSGVIAVTLIPMLASRMIRRSADSSHGFLYRITERGFDAWLRGYAATLRWALDHGPTVMVSLALTLAMSVFLFRAIPKGLFPSEDRGQLSVQTEGIEGISFDAMVARQQAIAGVIQQEPGVEAFMSSAGARGTGAGNTGRCFIRLRPRSERGKSADEIIQSLRPKLAAVPGIRAFPINPPLINIGGRMARSQYQYTLQSTDSSALYAAASALEQRLRATATLQDVSSDMQLRNPTVRVDIDRDRTASLRLSAAAVETALFNAYGSREISTILTPDNQYLVLLELLPQYQTSPDLLSLLRIRSGTGNLVPLDSVARLRQTVTPITVNHSGQLPSVTLSFNLRPGAALGDAVKDIDAASRDLVPASVTTNFQGTAQVFQSSVQGLGLLLLVAIFVIYVVLGILYENYWHPVTILTSLPSAAIGALLTLMAFRKDLSLYAFVGIIMLIGLVKKNGIMMVDFAVDAQRREGKSPRDAVYAACLVRFRPIMMTTLTSLAAALPIALGYGAGGEARQPLGLTVVGGMLFSQSITLYVTPVFYVYMERFQDFLRKRKEGSANAV